MHVPSRPPVHIRFGRRPVLAAWCAVMLLIAMAISAAGSDPAAATRLDSSGWTTTARVGRAQVEAGGWETISVTVTSTIARSGLLYVEFNDGTAARPLADSTGARVPAVWDDQQFAAGVPATYFFFRLVPPDTQPAAYRIRIGIFGVHWIGLQHWNDDAAEFEVVGSDGSSPTTPAPPTTDPVPTTVPPAPSTTVPPEPSTTVPPSPPTSAPSTGTSNCGLAAAAFCETFDAPAGDPASRSGDLDPVVWGVSRVNTKSNFTQGEMNDWLDTTLQGCGADQVVNAPRDVQVCDGRVVESVTDGEGQSTLAMYPKQPFDIAGARAGTVVFDTSADSQGGHAAWQEFWWTDQPVPAPHGHMPSNFTTARNSFGFDIDGQCVGDVPYQRGDHQPYVGVDGMHITTNYLESDLDFTRVGCVLKGTLTSLNHFEVRFNVNGHTVEVWGSDPGGTNLHLLAYTSTPLPLTRGVIWLEDLHYNANKFDTQGTHTFAWDNVGFDGPAPYRDLTFDLQDSHTSCRTTQCQQLGYYVGQDPSSLVVHDVNWEQTPTASYVAFTWNPDDPAVPEVRVNNGAWQTLPWPGGDMYTARTIAIPIPFADVITGDNTIQLRYHNGQPPSTDGGTVVSNLNLVLIAAAPVS